MIRPFFAFLTLLLLAQTVSPASAASMSLARSALLEDNIVYLRVGHISSGLADEISSAGDTLTGTNKIIGTVLDLREASGDDVTVLKSTSDVLAARKLPLTILVNNDTQGTATALASKLRQSRLGLIFGSATLGLKPDITVTVDSNSEKTFLNNPYSGLSTNETNLLIGTNDFMPYVDHTSEAQLVDERRKDGADDDNLPPAPRAEPPHPVINDPVLARAVDLIKGLAVIRAARG
jgi:hypothetical protein